MGTMYLCNRWYVAAWAHELDAGPLARTIMDEPVVLYRAGDGEVAALENACAHRYVPLSLGTVGRWPPITGWSMTVPGPAFRSTLAQRLSRGRC